MYRSGRDKKTGKGLAHGVKARAVRKVTDHPNHIFNKPHGMIAASHHPKVNVNVSSSAESEESEE